MIVARMDPLLYGQSLPRFQLRLSSACPFIQCPEFLSKGRHCQQMGFQIIGRYAIHSRQFAVQFPELLYCFPIFP